MNETGILQKLKLLNVILDKQRWKNYCSPGSSTNAGFTYTVCLIQAILMPYSLVKLRPVQYRTEQQCNRRDVCSGWQMEGISWSAQLEKKKNKKKWCGLQRGVYGSAGAWKRAKRCHKETDHAISMMDRTIRAIPSHSKVLGSVPITAKWRRQYGFSASNRQSPAARR